MTDDEKKHPDSEDGAALKQGASPSDAPRPAASGAKTLPEGESAVHPLDAEAGEPAAAEARRAARDGAGGSEEEEDAPDPNDRGTRRGLLAAAGALALASLFGPIASSGLWDPHELQIADQARRIAVALLGAQSLVIDGAVNVVPTAGELGRGELPFTSVALGFKLFGLHEWAGRIPLALWGLVGLASTFALLSRLADRAVASMAVIVLATSPLYFIQARTILGDVVTMAAIATATSGLAIATFDDRLGVGARIGWLLLGALGMAAGFGARGVLPGVALPALSVGFAAFLLRTSGGALGGSRPKWLGLALLNLGIGAAMAGVYSMLSASETEFSRVLGSKVEQARQMPTHDFVIHYLGHGLLPWSALIPFALGRLFRPPPGVVGTEAERQSALRLTVLLSAALGFGIYGMLAPVVGNLPFGPVFALAAAVALSIRDFEKGVPGSRALAVGVAALAILFYTDYKNFPEKGLAAFAISGATFPDSFKELGTHIVKFGAVASAALFFLAFFERQKPAAEPFQRREYANWIRVLRRAYGGNLVLVLEVIEAALVVVAVLVYLSNSRYHWQPFETLSAPLMTGAKYGFFAFPLLLTLPWCALIARDATRWFFSRVPVTRGTAAVASLAAFGTVMSLWYYPALASQISPKDVFESYQRLAQSGEELAMMGGGSGSASYYTGQDVRTFSNTNTAFNWLVERPAERRWLVARAPELAQMNALFRGRQRENLPVLDARSSEVLLVSNQLRPGEGNENPFDAWVRSERPTPTRKSVDANFGGQLEVIGWDVTDPSGKPVDTVRAGKPYQFRFYYEVQKAISGSWKTFIHVDGFQRRFNGDHDTLQGKYPFHLWKVGDYIVDIHDFELEPNFTPGMYQVYFGFFQGDRRLDVKRGHHKDNRVHAGSLRVE